MTSRNKNGGDSMGTWYREYRVARNVGGVKLWRINEILHWRRKLWRKIYFGDQVEMSGGCREMLAA